MPPGPPPKVNKARRNKDVVGMQTVAVEPYEQPLLKEVFGSLVNPLDQRTDLEDERDRKFLPLTKRLWSSLATFPTTRSLQEPQWLLLASAVALWDIGVKTGRLSCLAEANKQLGRFGIAPHDVLRMRINLAEADSKEEKAASSRARRRGGARERLRERDLGGDDL